MSYDTDQNYSKNSLADKLQEMDEQNNQDPNMKVKQNQRWKSLTLNSSCSKVYENCLRIINSQVIKTEDFDSEDKGVIDLKEQFESVKIPNLQVHKDSNNIKKGENKLERHSKASGSTHSSSSSPKCIPRETVIHTTDNNGISKSSPRHIPRHPNISVKQYALVPCYICESTLEFVDESLKEIMCGK